MVRGIGRRGDRPFLLFGLSDDNIRRLQAGQPIFVALDDGMLGPNAPAYDVLVMYGPTEEDIRAELEATHGPPSAVVTRGDGISVKYAPEDDVDGA